MASTERFHIKVTEDGSRVVSRRLDQLGGRALSAERNVFLLRRALRNLGIGVAAAGVVRLADSYVILQNRLSTVTNSQRELNVVTQELFDISERTRSSLNATVELYTRTALSVRDLGRSQRETLNFTESLNQAIILSGAGVQESENALIQLSQGLASGALRGDELRSVLEQLPIVADVIAKEIGVTRGELRALGAEGKITSEVILNAFKASREELSERFAKTIPTVQQAFLLLRNSAINAIGQFERATGFTEGLARAIISLSKNFVEFIRVVLAASVALAVQFAGVGIRLAIAGIQRLTLAIVNNPFGALATAIAATIGLLVAFSDRIKASSDGIANLQDLAFAAFESIGRNIETVQQAFDEAFTFVADIFGQTFDGFNLDFEDFLRFAARYLDTYVGFWIGAFRAITTGAKLLPEALNDIVAKAIDGLIAFIQELPNLILQAGRVALASLASLAQSVINSYISVVNRLYAALNIALIETVDFGGVVERGEVSAEEFGAKIKEAFTSGFEFDAVESGLDRLLGRANEIAEARIKKLKEEAEATEAARRALSRSGTNNVTSQSEREFQKIIERLQKEGDLLRINVKEREILRGVFGAEASLRRDLSATEEQLIRQLEVTNQQLAARAEILDGLAAPQRDFLTGQKALQQLLAEGGISNQQYTISMAQLEQQFLQTFDAQGFSQNFRTAIRELEIETRDALGRIGQLLGEIYGPGGTLSRGFGETFANAVFLTGQIDAVTGKAITFGEAFKTGIQQVSEAIIKELIGALVQLGVNIVLNNTVARALGTAALVSTQANAAAASAAWATPAALASLATLGANALPANAAVAGTVAAANGLAALPGFQSGGFTGDVAPNQVAGFVHGREFVVNERATQRNRGLLERINKGENPGGGGTVVNVYAVDPGIAIEQRQVSPGEVEVIARRVVRDEAGKVVAADIDNPNGQTSKSLARNLQVTRKR